MSGHLGPETEITDINLSNRPLSDKEYLPWKRRRNVPSSPLVRGCQENIPMTKVSTPKTGKVISRGFPGWRIMAVEPPIVKLYLKPPCSRKCGIVRIIGRIYFLRM